MKIYIAHNQYGHANPSCISPTGTEVVFDLKKISIELKNKIFGKIDLVELSVEEMNEIKNAKTGTRTVGEGMLKNIYK